MRENNKKSILFLHVAVMLFGFSGVLAQYVQVPAVLVAMGRVIVTSGNIACEEGQADTGIKKGLCIDYRNRCDHGDSLVQLLSGNPGVIGSNRNDHIFYISTVSDVYGAGRVQRKASGEERDQRSDSAGWCVYYGAGIFCGESGDRGNPMGNAV